jgi:UDP-2-acetamido-3-amino-2,3-dideoxy-glucuronate N-acetyltransferase
MENQLRMKFSPEICVAGCGHWGKNLIRNFHLLGSLAGVYDADRTRTDAFASQYQVNGFSSFEAVLQDPAVKGVAIATPAEMHAAMAIAALRAGKDVFVEKPLALRTQDGVEMVERARASGKILMVGHLLMYHPAVVKIQELLHSGELGRLEYIYSNRLSMGKIRREENALWSFAPHDISVVLALMGDIPLQATAVGGAYVQPNLADVTVSNLLFDHGVRAHIFVSWLHPYKEQRLVVIGSKKMVVFEDTRPTDKLLMFDKQIDLSKPDVQVTQPKAAPVAFDSTEPLSLECAHFAECLRDRTPPRTTGESGVDVLRVLQACQKSIQMNGEPVQVAPVSLEMAAL